MKQFDSLGAGSRICFLETALLKPFIEEKVSGLCEILFSHCFVS